MVSEGDKAPAFNLTADDGKPVTLAKLNGRMLVLYFYPKDDTPGCTSEAKAFSALSDAFEAAGARVLGVSPDSAESHARFREKFGLAHRLLSDPDAGLAKTFGVWVEKSMYGRKYMGVERSTFLIDAKGKVVRGWRKVKVPGHAEEVLAAVEELAAS